MSYLRACKSTQQAHVSVVCHGWELRRPNPRSLQRPNFRCSTRPASLWHCAATCSVRTPVQVARKPRQNRPRLRKLEPSSIASNKPPMGAANAVATPAAETSQRLAGTCAYTGSDVMRSCEPDWRALFPESEHMVRDAFRRAQLPYLAASMGREASACGFCRMHLACFLACVSSGSSTSHDMGYWAHRRLCQSI